MKPSAQKQKHSSEFGFTLIELLIVIALIGILTASVIPVFEGFTTRQRLAEAAQNVRADLRSAQNRAVSGVEGKAWGVNISVGDSHYTIFKCPTSVSPAYTLASCSAGSLRRDLPSTSFTIQTPGFSNLAFDSVSGDLFVDGSPVSAGSYSFEVVLGSDRRVVTITAGGQIE